MKKLILLLTLVASGLMAKGQNNIGLYFSQNFSTFRFLNNDGEKEDLKYTIKYGYGLIYQIQFDSNIFAEGLLSYNNKGANSQIGNTKLDWSFHYVNLGINGGYKFNLGRIQPHVGTGFYYGHLLKADQFIGIDYYDLMSMDIISMNDLGLNIFGGMSYEYSRNGFVFIRLNQEIGLLQMEKDDEDNQKMFNRTFSIQLGLLFNIN